MNWGIRDEVERKTHCRIVEKERGDLSGQITMQVICHQHHVTSRTTQKRSWSFPSDSGKSSYHVRNSTYINMLERLHIDNSVTNSSWPSQPKASIKCQPSCEGAPWISRGWWFHTTIAQPFIWLKSWDTQVKDLAYLSWILDPLNH
jgi:hypothetical protein